MQKSLLMTAALLAMTSVASAQLLVTEDFSYADASLLVGAVNPAGTWAESSTGINPLTVGATSVTYGGTGLAAPTGGSLFLNDNGQDAALPFGLQTMADGESLYYSLTFVHDGTDIGGTGGNYFAMLTDGTDPLGFLFRARLFAADDGTGAMQLGIAYSSVSAQGVVAYVTGKNIAANTPAFVVVKLTRVAGAANDTASVFVFTGATSVPDTEPAADATTVPVAGTIDFADIGLFGLRQGTTTLSAKLTVDGIRVGRTWADVGGTDSVVPSSADSWEMYE